ncbi:MAG: TRAP transporter large permease subunit [Burkholderiales bacterium]|nr:TRAP transporter large permease subunit [Burkholderiales bacterium]
MRKELWFGLSIMAMVVIACFVVLPAPSEMTYGHLGLLMLGLVVVAIMLGFPTAFTLMGMGVIFGWIAFAYDTPRILDLMVQRTYAVMSNDVLIAVPLFVFMGYLVERANLIEKLFKSMHLAMSRIPGSLAVATIATCAIFATATGIVGAVVTLMGLLAFPAMLRAGYNVKVSAGAITAGGCLGILIPPSVLLIVYGATAGVSVVQLYAGAFFPGIMLAALYVAYVIVLAKLRPALMPPLPAEERKVKLPHFAQVLSRDRGKVALPALFAGFGRRNGLPTGVVARNLFVALLPALAGVFLLGLLYRSATAPLVVQSTEGLVEFGSELGSGAVAGKTKRPPAGLGVQEPPVSSPPPSLDQQSLGVQEPPLVQEPGGAQDPSAAQNAPLGVAEPPGAESVTSESPAEATADAAAADGALAAPTWFWITFAVIAAALLIFYALLSFARLEIFKMLLGSFFPLAMLILAVLGSIVFGLATPAEAAAMGSLGGLLLAAAYRQLNRGVLQESVFLTAKTTAMVCWLFVGSSIFSASFALLGGQELIERWVLSMNLAPVEFMLLAQVIIFLLGWPLEWTEIIVIFMPIFVPLLQHFNIDPLFFGLLVAMNLQTAFLSPPVAMAAFYLKGVAPPHVTLGQIFSGMLPYMAIQVFAMFLLYMWPAIGLWLPNYLYK